MAVKLASEIYGQQNKMIHRGLSGIGMPYAENKGLWIPVFREVIGRKNVTSLSDLTLGERHAVISHLIRRGQDLFNPKVSVKIRDWKKGDRDVLSGKIRRPIRVDSARQPLVGKIGAILADLKLPWGYADGIARKRFGKKVVEYCSYTELLKVAQMLAIHQKRHGAGKPVGLEAGRRETEAVS